MICFVSVGDTHAPELAQTLTELAGHPDEARVNGRVGPRFHLRGFPAPRQPERAGNTPGGTSSTGIVVTPMFVPCSEAGEPGEFAYDTRRTRSLRAHRSATGGSCAPPGPVV